MNENQTVNIGDDDDDNDEDKEKDKNDKDDDDVYLPRRHLASLSSKSLLSQKSFDMFL